jgi:hypothetical protein
MKYTSFQVFLILLLISSIIVFPTTAQSEDELTIRLRRNFGYSSGTGKIQGTFTMKVAGPESLDCVTFFIDDDMIGEVDTPPFDLRFQTGDYTLGTHTLTAIGFTQVGSELSSNQIRVKFVSAEEGWIFVLKILIPLLAIIFGGILLSYIISTFVGRRSNSDTPLGSPRNYGLWGGAICPKCSRPFGRHIWGLNLGLGKFDRCPHCGKWSLVRRALPEELRAAEVAELELAVDRDQAPVISEEEKLHKELDDSRYHDF